MNTLYSWPSLFRSCLSDVRADPHGQCGLLRRQLLPTVWTIYPAMIFRCVASLWSTSSLTSSEIIQGQIKMLKFLLLRLTSYWKQAPHKCLLPGAIGAQGADCHIRWIYTYIQSTKGLTDGKKVNESLADILVHISNNLYKVVMLLCSACK